MELRQCWPCDLAWEVPKLEPAEPLWHEDWAGIRHLWPEIPAASSAAPGQYSSQAQMVEAARHCKAYKLGESSTSPPCRSVRSARSRFRSRHAKYTRPAWNTSTSRIKLCVGRFERLGWGWPSLVFCRPGRAKSECKSLPSLRTFQTRLGRGNGPLMGMWEGPTILCILKQLEERHWSGSSYYKVNYERSRKV